MNPAHSVVITADDFGASEAVNNAIIRWHASGVVTRASLMVNEPHAREAVEMAKAHPGLRIGLHLVLCAGLASQVRPGLTDRAGNLPASPAIAGLRYFFQRQTLEPLIRAEIAAQFQKFQDLGLPPTYVDGHTHLHLHPSLFPLVVCEMQTRGFSEIRLVREKNRKTALAQIFRMLSGHAIRSVPSMRDGSIAFADQTHGLSDTGRISDAWMINTLSHLERGRSEIYFHPGVDPAAAPESVAEEIRKKNLTISATIPLLSE